MRTHNHSELLQLARSNGSRPIEVGNRHLAMGMRPGHIQTNVERSHSRTGRPMGVGRRRRMTRRRASVGQRSQASPSGLPQDCQTYDPPAILVGPDGCDIGYNGCGDTVGVDVNVLANATVDINIQAAIEFSPRYFIYGGPLATFNLLRIFVANGPNSNFGAGYTIDYYALTSFTSKRVSWPTFYNSPPLTLTVQNLTGAAVDFEGFLIGVASHQ